MTEDEKKTKLLQKYLEKKKKQRKRDDLLKEIAEISQSRGQEIKSEIIKKREKRSKNKRKKIERFGKSANVEQAPVKAVECMRKAGRHELYSRQSSYKSNEDDNLLTGKESQLVSSSAETCGESSGNQERDETEKGADGDGCLNYLEECGQNHEMVSLVLAPEDLQEKEQRPESKAKEDHTLRYAEGDENENQSENLSLAHPALHSQSFVLSRVQSRKEELQNWRKSLDIFYEEARIVSAIKSNAVTFIQGETGCGKSTQIPQFLLEHGFHNHGRICVTQPRRLAAISISTRINFELNQKISGYKIKYENTIREGTLIKVVTEGVLLREIASDYLLSEYSVIILDEVHERSTNIDVLMGFLSKVVQKRLQGPSPLRIVLMSATNCFSLFRTLFPSSPLVSLKSKSFKVSVCYEEKTPRNLIAAIHEKVQMIVTAEKRPRKNRTSSELYRGRLANGSGNMMMGSGDQQIENDSSASILVFLPGKEEIYTLKARLEASIPDAAILPLHSSLSVSDQNAVYKDYGKRKIILATNIAETSLTIPDVVFVIDSGLEKTCTLDELSVKYHVGFVSKSSAEQRTGRAGRTRAGVCFRIYTGDTYEHFADYTLPEIHRAPLDGPILFLKSLGIRNVLRFPLPEPLDSTRVKQTQEVLHTISALTEEGEITEYGLRLSKYPLPPQVANVIGFGKSSDVYDYMHVVASILSVDLEISRTSDTEVYFANAFSDLIVGLRICKAYFMAENRAKFARKIGVSRTSLDEVIKLSRYLLRISGVELDDEGGFLASDNLTEEKERRIRRIICLAYTHHLAINSGRSFLHKGGEVFTLKDSVAVESRNFVFSHILSGRNRDYAKNITIIDSV